MKRSARTEAGLRKYIDVLTKEIDWLENMLSYSSNLLSQIQDLSTEEIERTSDGHVTYFVSTGPASEPDKYDIQCLLREIRIRRPNY